LIGGTPASFIIKAAIERIPDSCHRQVPPEPVMCHPGLMCLQPADQTIAVFEPILSFTPGLTFLFVGVPEPVRAIRLAA